VEKILHELELDRTPRLLIFNKSDLASPEPAENGALYVSAATGEGLAALRAAVLERIE
jgi:50S ribosomal subunit-associated GTPase HflX